MDRHAALFTTDAELSNHSGRKPHRGGDGARAFWREYHDAFQTIRSRFSHVLEGGDAVVLEWVSDCALADGTEISYRGVSVLEWSGDLVHRFRTYYDSAALRSGQDAAAPSGRG